MMVYDLKEMDDTHAVYFNNLLHMDEGYGQHLYKFLWIQSSTDSLDRTHL